jgi:3-hydroxyacyl-[acyl-carrier-protein] dehydratase
MHLEYFQMLDEIAEFDPNEVGLTAKATVPVQSPVFEGHFPGEALMPGVLLLETMAQASGYLILSMNGFSRMPFFASVKTANFRSFVRPGSHLTVRSKRIHDGSGFTVTSTSIERKGVQVCDAQLTMRNVVFPSAALQEHVRREGRRLGLFDATASS